MNRWHDCHEVVVERDNNMLLRRYTMQYYVSVVVQRSGPPFEWFVWSQAVVHAAW